MSEPLRFDRVLRGLQLNGPCPECGEAMDGTLCRRCEGDHRRARTHDVVRQRRVERRLRDPEAYLARCGVPPEYRAMELASFRGLGLLERRYPELGGWKGQPPMLLLRGAAGVGKTHLATGLLRRLVVGEGWTAAWYDAVDLLRQLRRGFTEAEGGRSDIEERVLQAEILLLDDLGQEKVTEWAAEELSYLLRMRYSHQQATIITTNRQVPELAERLGEGVASRLGSGLEIPLGGRDRRKTGSPS